MTKAVPKGDRDQPFLTDVKTLRDRARNHLETGNVTQSYKGDVTQAIAILQSVLATEIVCVLRYTMHSIAATGISSEGVKAAIKRVHDQVQLPTGYHARSAESTRVSNGPMRGSRSLRR